MKKPRITIMGDHGMEEVDYDTLPDNGPADLADYFASVRISERAVDVASKIIPEEHYKAQGLHAFLAERANKVFQTIPAGAREGKFRTLRCIFEFDDKGPALKTVSL